MISSRRQLDQECPVEGQVRSEGLVKSSLQEAVELRLQCHERR